MSGNELDRWPYRPSSPPWWPGDESGYDAYHRQLYRLTAEQSGFIRWKVLSSGVNVARQLAGARNLGVSAWVREHGTDPSGWPVPHPPAVLWRPQSAAHGACLRCLWIDGDTGDLGAAASAARRHAAEHLPDGSPALRLLLEPVRVWHRGLDGSGPPPRTAG